MLKKILDPQIPIFLPKNKGESETVIRKLLDLTNDV